MASFPPAMSLTDSRFLRGLRAPRPQGMLYGRGSPGSGRTEGHLELVVEGCCFVLFFSGVDFFFLATFFFFPSSSFCGSGLGV